MSFDYHSNWYDVGTTITMKNNTSYKFTPLKADLKYGHFKGMTPSVLNPHSEDTFVVVSNTSSGPKGLIKYVTYIDLNLDPYDYIEGEVVYLYISFKHPRTARDSKYRAWMQSPYFNCSVEVFKGFGTKEKVIYTIDQIKPIKPI